MFTGIVQAVGTVRSLERQGSGARLRVALPAALRRRLKKGDSLAVNGCCLTLLAQSPSQFAADLTRETLERTNLGQLAPGARVNLEAPLRLGDLLSGHMMQGHVEGTGRLLAFTRLEGAAAGWSLRIAVPGDLARYLVPKGSLAVDGISLTIARLLGPRRPGAGATIEIAVIPHTYRATALRWLAPGAALNLETDPLARHVERLLRYYSKPKSG